MSKIMLKIQQPKSILGYFKLKKRRAKQQIKV